MKLNEIYGTGADQTKERNWRDQMVSQHAVRAADKAAIVKGFWLVAPDGKKLSGPFTDEAKAMAFKINRPDRIPTDAVVKEM